MNTNVQTDYNLICHIMASACMSMTMSTYFVYVLEDCLTTIEN